MSGNSLGIEPCFSHMCCCDLRVGFESHSKIIQGRLKYKFRTLQVFESLDAINQRSHNTTNNARSSSLYFVTNRRVDGIEKYSNESPRCHIRVRQNVCDCCDKKNYRISETN